MTHPCTCDPTQVARYRSRISGPLRDRIDLHLDVPAIPYAELAGRPGGESSLAIRERVTRASVLKVARTIADLEGAGRIEEPHLAEAIQYRG